MYQIAVDVSMLAPDVAAVLEQAPAVLPAWDPMGALAVCTEPADNSPQPQGAARL
eukprot:SAG22_NODE_408_length_10942_cov_6.157429_10_plen_55_part_00